MTMDIPPELVEQFARGDGAVFVGAGLSQAAGFPGWSDFVRQLAAEIEGCPPDALPRDIAQYYEIEHGRKRLVEKLRDAFDPPYGPNVQPTRNHALIATLPISTILTTNYDDLLEQALTKARRPFDSIAGDVEVSFSSSGRLQLVRLYGDPKQADSITITAEDHERFAKGHLAVARLLKMTLQRCTVLLLGYHAIDLNLRTILTQVRDESGSFARTHYTVQSGTPRIVRKDLERRGLRVIELGEQPNINAQSDALHRWLGDLDRRVKSAAPRSRAVAIGPKKPVDLPPLGGKLVGRDREIAQLMEYLREGRSPLVLEGMAGMGKSAVATVVAHQCHDEGLFNTIVWWTAKYKPRPLSDLLDKIGRVLGHRTDSGQPTYDSPEGTYDLLRQHRCLLVVTKVTQLQHAKILDFLNRVPARTCVVLSTTWGIAFGRHIRIGPLDKAASLELIRLRAEQLDCPALLAMDDSQLEPLCTFSDGSPVALRQAVGLVKRGVHLDRVLEKLQSGADRLGILCAGAYSLLTESAKDALHLICTSRDSISGEALKHILQDPRAVIEEEYLARLRDMALVQSHYAPTWMQSRFSPANRLVREHYSTSMHIMQPARDRSLRDAAAVYYYQECQQKGYQNWSGQDWIEKNLGEILNTLDWYESTHQKDLFIGMMKSIAYFLGTRGYWRERLTYGDRAGQMARQQDDRRSEAEMLVAVIGWTEIQLCKYVQAREDIRRGLKMFVEVEDNTGCARAYRYLGTIKRRQGHFDQAIGFYKRAMDYAQAAPDNARLIAGIRVSLGTLYFKTDRLVECEQHLQEALRLFEEWGHKPRTAEVLSRLGDVRLKQGQAKEAERLYRRSDEYAQKIELPKTEAYNLLGLARIAHKRGEYQAARDYAEQAREAFGNLGIADEAAEMSDLHALIGQ